MQDKVNKQKEVNVNEIIDELPEDEEGKKEILFMLKGYNLAKDSERLKGIKKGD